MEVFRLKRTRDRSRGAAIYGVRLGLLFCLFFFSAWLLSELGIQSVAKAVSASKKEEAEAPFFTVVLDAGHGGEDGGATGTNGVLEKTLNLKIAEMVKEELEAKGYRVVMTRTEDKLLYTEEQNIRGKRKQYDLKNRLDKAMGEENPILVSIHMNRFSQAKYNGLQVYYSKNHEGSRLLAEKIQTTAVKTLQPYNRRQIKPSSGTIYLLDQASMPAVLIECGFLSNHEECQKLSDKEYQKQLSFSIVCAMIEYMEQVKPSS